MKLVTFRDQVGRLRPGVMTEEGVIDLIATDGTLPGSVRGILAHDDLPRVAEMAESASAVIVQNAQLEAPIPDPQKIVCIGLNYRDHARETGKEIPAEPIVFCKFPTAVIGPDRPICLPKVSDSVDFEAELVAVIGKQAKHVSEAEALDYVAGYTLGNDVSARDWQLKRSGGQFTLGKSFDTFAPTGPAITTSDEIDDPTSLPIRMRLNGEVMQESNTRELIFSVAKLVAHLSQVFTFEPGDLLFTGTPSGVGAARKPPRFLQPGDICEVEIDQLGTLQNPCEHAD